MLDSYKTVCLQLIGKSKIVHQCILHYYKININSKMKIREFFSFFIHLQTFLRGGLLYLKASDWYYLFFQYYNFLIFQQVHPYSGL